ncbi:MAG: Lrp/AsnC family transcriptional regulator [Paracoccaceae bacterium]
MARAPAKATPGSGKIDRIDAQILAALRANARLSLTALAAEVGLTPSPTQARIRRLECDGIITGYHAQIDPIQAGHVVIGFVELRVRDKTPEALARVAAAITGVPWVTQAHAVAGDYDFLLQVQAPDMASLTEGLGHALSALPHPVDSRVALATQVIQGPT